MLNCTTDRYGKLYARYLERPGDLLDIGGLQPGERVLDLCGGTGVTAVEALNRGARKAVLLDLNPRCSDPRVVQVKGTAEEMTYYTPLVFDLIVCRQAISYLDLRTIAEKVGWLLAEKRGRFVFNNFRRPKWDLRWYKHAGRRYLEASCFFGRDVFHLQASPTVGVDVTRFRWYSDEEIRRAFDGYRIDSFETEKTYYYTVRKS